MQFRHLAWLISGLMLGISINALADNALAENSATKSAQQTVNNVCAA